MQVDLSAIEDPAEYYDERHERGWMDYWPETKKARVIGMIQELNLPHGAKVLEYGCGTGVFTDAVKRRLPWLEVHGCDISMLGVRKAKQRCANIPFHVLGEADAAALVGQFDLIYTHHVLEHVTDLAATLEIIATFLKPAGKMLHILPCGNWGSLEQRISGLALSTNGASGRFTTDDSSHLRRLSSQQLIAASTPHGLEVELAYFANQFWGGIDYLSNYYYGLVLLNWVNPMRGLTVSARLRLLGLALLLYPLSQVRHRPRHILRGLTMEGHLSRKLFYSCLAPFALILYPFSIIFDRGLTWLVSREWRLRNTEPNGAEMYLLFRKEQAA